MTFNTPTPKQLGFSFPAEFAQQRALWLSWPHKEASWPGKLHTIYKPYCEFILQVSRHQKVCINVADTACSNLHLQKLKNLLLMFRELN